MKMTAFKPAIIITALLAGSFWLGPMQPQQARAEYNPLKAAPDERVEPCQRVYLEDGRKGKKASVALVPYNLLPKRLWSLLKNLY